VIPRWLVEFGKVLLTTVGVVAALTAFMSLPVTLLSLLGPWLPGGICFGGPRCWPMRPVLGIGSIVIGFALASWLYGEGYLVLPDVW